jgi:hypothetical protein
VEFFVMLIKGNALPDEQNKMETSGWGTTKIVVCYSKLNKIFRNGELN